MPIGEKLWEGKGKSEGAGAIKSIDMEGVTSEYSWSAQMKGMGRAKGLDGMIHVTATGKNPPKGVYTSKDLGIFMMAGGEMCTLMGKDLMAMTGRGNPQSVGLWHFMTMSQKLDWLNSLIAIVEFQALDPMWMESNITIYEWKP